MSFVTAGFDKGPEGGREAMTNQTAGCQTEPKGGNEEPARAGATAPTAGRAPNPHGATASPQVGYHQMRLRKPGGANGVQKTTPLFATEKLIKIWVGGRGGGRVGPPNAENFRRSEMPRPSSRPQSGSAGRQYRINRLTG